MSSVKTVFVDPFTIRDLGYAKHVARDGEVVYDDAELTLFVHRALYGPRWCVSESSTGFAVVQMQPTREAAMAAAMGVVDVAQLHARKWRNHLGERMVWRDGSGHVK